MVLFDIVNIFTFALYFSTAFISADINKNTTTTAQATGTTTESILTPVSAPVFESAISTPKNDQTKVEDKNNYLVRFRNAKDGQVITLDGDQPTPGINVTANVWNNSDSQKFLLLKRGDVYLILPKRQHRDWANFLKRTSKGGSDNLPSVTVVLGIDIQNGRITQQVLHGRSNQHWEFKDAKESRIFITSPARSKCIGAKTVMDADANKPSFIQRTALKIKGLIGSTSKKTLDTIEPFDLVASDCNESDQTQLWQLEPVTA